MTKQEQITELESQLTGNMMQDMDVKDQIHNLQMEIDGIKPDHSSEIDCIGCGS